MVDFLLAFVRGEVSSADSIIAEGAVDFDLGALVVPVDVELLNRSVKKAAAKDTTKFTKRALLLVAAPLVVAILLVALASEDHVVQVVCEKPAEVVDVEIASTTGARVVAPQLPARYAVAAVDDFAVPIPADLWLLNNM